MKVGFFYLYFVPQVQVGLNCQSGLCNEENMQSTVNGSFVTGSYVARCFVADIFECNCKLLGNINLKLNRIYRRVRVGILESILYKNKEKVGILSLK